MDPLVSVIIPIYNNEKWMLSCVRSVLEQSYSNLDILLIDDGSCMKVAGLCDNFAMEDARVRVYHLQNGGVSRARNIGIENSRGDYIVFIDSDDLLEKDIICKALKFQEEHAEYFCKWGMAYLNDKGENDIYHAKIIAEPNMTEWKAAIINGGSEKINIGATIKCVWGAIFRTHIIREFSVRFTEELYIGEDAVFLMKYLKYVYGIAYMDETGYFYRIHSESACRKYKKDLLEQQLRGWQEMMFQLTEIEQSIKNIQEAFSGNAWNVFNGLVDNARKGYTTGCLSKHVIAKDALKWYELNKQILKEHRLQSRVYGRLISLESILSKIVTPKMIFWLAYIRGAWRELH